MKGTEKQVKWAEDIIKKSIANLTNECENRIPGLKKECISEEKLERDLARNELIKSTYAAAINEIAEIAGASKIINVRRILTNGSELRGELVKAVRFKKDGQMLNKINAKLEEIVK